MAKLKTTVVIDGKAYVKGTEDSDIPEKHRKAISAARFEKEAAQAQASTSSSGGEGSSEGQGGKGDEAKALNRQNLDELRATAHDLGVAYEDDDTKAQLTAKIKAAQEEQ